MIDQKDDRSRLMSWSITTIMRISRFDQAGTTYGRAEAVRQHLVLQDRAVTDRSRYRVSTFLGDGGTEVPVIYPPRLEAWAFPRKEVIQPHLPVRLPCYDFTPIIDPTFDGSLP